MKVALYARVSSERQAEKDLSIPAQLKALRSHALKLGWEVVREFVDEAESARTANRPRFQEMIACAKQKPSPYQAILVWKLSRFARNREDSILYKTLLRKRGVQVISINEQFDDSPTGKLLEGMIEAMDEFYSANLAQDTRRGMKENAQRGFLNGARLPYGYQPSSMEIGGVKKRIMEISKTEAPAVRRAFDLCLQGEGTVAIAQTLTAEGYRTRRGKAWSKTGVLYLLRNEAYVGTYVWNRSPIANNSQSANQKCETVRIENHHLALVDQSAFTQAQRLLTQKAPKTTHPRIAGSNHILSGLIFCGHCGRTMTAASAKSGRFVYYSCQRKLKEGKAGCSQKSLNAEKLEPCILDVIKVRLLTEGHLSKLLRMVCEELQDSGIEATEKLTFLKARLEEIESKQRKYFDLIESDSIPLADVAPRLKELRAAKEALLEQKTKLQDVTNNDPLLPPSASVVRTYVEDLQDTLRQGSVMHQKAFLRSFIKRIGIRDNEAEIEYTCPIGLSRGRKSEVLPIGQIGDPNGNRTRAAAVKGRCPNR